MAIKEIVKEFNYLGYILADNGKDEKHTRMVEGKANAVIGKLWGIGERNFKEDWNGRMKLFDAVVKGIIMWSGNMGMGRKKGT